MKNVVVIGAGFDGLAAATWLAQLGYPVTVLERRSLPGGQAALEEFHPGYRLPGICHHTFGLRTRVADALGLAEHGLRRPDLAPPLVALTPEGPGIALRAGDDDLPEGLYRRTPEDVRAWTHWRRLVRELEPLAAELVDHRPPPVRPDGLRGLADVARPALAFRRQGADTMVAALRNGPMSVSDHLSDRFDDALLCGVLASRGIEGGFLGPRSAGSASLLLLREALYGPGVVGGPTALTEALVSAAQAAGARLTFEAEVARLRVSGSRVTGVQTTDGRTFDAALVLSTVGVVTTLDRFLEPGSVGLRVRETVQAVRRRGCTAAVRLALSRPPRFRGREDERVELARLATDMDSLERAFDRVKHREAPDRGPDGSPGEPWLDLAVPSFARADLAPEGHATMSVLVPCAAMDVEGGWTDERKDGLRASVLERLRPVTVDLEDSIVATQVVAPPELAERFALDGGHLYGAELDLAQMWALRPSVRFGRYTSPIDGLYLGGRATHPGADFLGASGLAAAEAIVADEG